MFNLSEWNKLRLQLFIFIVILFATNLFSQEPFNLDNWKAHTSIINVKSSIVDLDGDIWCATDGGVFEYNQDDGIINVFRNINGLLSISSNAIGIEPSSGNIFIGSQDGYIDIIDSKNNEITHITDIAVFDIPNPIINKFLFIGELLYVAGGFGISVFNISEQVFEESILKLGDFPQNTEIFDIEIFDNKLWAATINGLAYADINSLLVDPNSWTNFTIESGLPDAPVLDILIKNEELFVISENQIFQFNNSQFNSLFQVPSNINSAIIRNDDILVSTESEIYSFNSQAKLTEEIFPATINSINLGPSNDLIINLANSGFALWDMNLKTHFIPNSPQSNNFESLTVDSRGNIWGSLSRELAGDGITVLKNDTWENYNQAIYNGLIDNKYHFIEELSNGHIISTNYGSGAIIINTDSEEFDFTLYDSSNTPMIGLDGPFLICGQPHTDISGRTWFPIMGLGEQGPAFVMIDQDGKFHVYNNRVSRLYRYFFRTTVDLAGTAWFGTWILGESQRGIYYLNITNTPENENDDIFGMISTSDYPDLISNSQTDMETDKLGLVWIGTQSGLNVIINPTAVLNNSQLIIRNVNLLAGQFINDIMIDALNFKWIATDSGVWVLNEDATDIIINITTENSELPTNEIISLAQDPNSGKIYFGTNQGLFEAQSLSVEPLSDYDITCYPQPFNPNNHKELIIEGLAPQTELRILTTNGQLIHSQFVRSRRTIWNGKDNNGNDVANGVYLIVAASENTENASVQKIAVVRK